ncbi:hypothetical protein UFOVP1329_5 [uncultured Caudovirales phage]|uniref:Uncharacterized protein n=1 Tax=uncultured Caudovirales phage TaxID=2100421 RepID=A0A6J5SV66_9CAUD|nr:hypothetical protein UFOVP1150_30 [uncultured Caudovirales phage]CAB4198896.1 hypothetical protein UFOVP1329_5 [uncultured Caudovirales phage]CAB4218674.1 hypothetical protein UFOVP1595_31 [uncultured Caudovirales phage]
MKLLLTITCLLLLPSCAAVSSFLINNEPTVESVLVYGVRSGINHLKTSAKNPEIVTP